MATELLTGATGSTTVHTMFPPFSLNWTMRTPNSCPPRSRYFDHTLFIGDDDYVITHVRQDKGVDRAVASHRVAVFFPVYDWFDELG